MPKSHYFIKIADNEIMALGNLFLDFPNFEKETTQYIIEIDNKLVKPYKLIDFNNLSTYSYKYGCVLNTNKNQTIFIGLLGSNIIYSSLR